MWCDPLIVRDWRKHIGYCTPDFWEADFDGRAAAYAQAATRPCTDVECDLSLSVHPWFLLHSAVALAFTERCQSTPPVAR